jgi:hypothetical protein
MRETKNDREQRKEAARLALCLWAGVICVTMLCSEVLGNKIDDVTVEPHYLETWSPVNCGESVCQCKYWVYVTWDVDPGSNQDSFTVEIWQPGEPNTDPNEDFRMPSGTMIGANSVGPSPLNTKVEITNSVGLTPGEHTIRAWVAGDDISSPGKWGHSEACTVYVAEVNDIDPEPNDSCVSSDVTFTADPNPPGKTLRCMEWEKGYKADSSSSWTWDPPETGGASRILNTSTPGIYSYRARNCKDYGCTDCNWVQSPDVNVVDVDKVVEKDTTDGGALYVCVGQDVNLEALPDPCWASFPEDQPTWQVLVKPLGSSPTLTPPDSNAITKLSGLSLPGFYFVIARCCNSIGDVIGLVAMDADMDTAYTTEADEETVGLFVPYNDDDDDSNGIEDSLGGAVSGEDEIRQASFSITPSLSTGEAKLEATAGSSNIKVFEDSSKSTEVTLPKTWDLSSESLPDKHYVEGYSTSSSLRDTELTLSYIRSGSTIESDKVKITVVDVDWAEDTTTPQTYGYDSYTNAFFPYKSVKVGGADTAYADISGSVTIANEVYFTASNAAVTVSPSSASSTHQKVSFTGVSEGFAQGHAELHDPAKDNVAASIGVYPYEEDSWALVFRVIWEEDDDVQDINVGDSGSSETDVCVSCGANGKRDTNKSGDDVYSGENILVGPDKVCNSWADDTNDVISIPASLTASNVQDHLNTETYNQAIVSWSVSQIGACTCNWDLDNDGKVDIGYPGGWSSEENVIISNCDPGGSHDVIVYYLKNPDPAYAGMAPKPGTFAFVYTDEASDDENVTAHEIGHAKFSLGDLKSPGSSDSSNLMWHAEPLGKRLRKGQWDTIQALKP